jgi:hypothetical protein
MKSGTTTLHELLAEHPNICMSEPKEPCYFVDPDLLKGMWPEMWGLGFWRDEASYLRLFSGKPTARYFGESSTDYSKLSKISGVVERIAAFSPGAHFIYIMRDPVERTLSHYWHMVEHRGEKRGPLEAIMQDPHYMDVSHYSMQLKPYIETFGRERLHVLTFEELTSDPAKAVGEVFRWLGVVTNFVPDSLSSAHNVTSQQLQQQRHGMSWLRSFRHSAFWGKIGPIAPLWLRRMGVSLIERPVQRTRVDVSEVIRYLKPIQREQTNDLIQLIGREFPEWKTLYG